MSLQEDYHPGRVAEDYFRFLHPELGAEECIEVRSRPIYPHHRWRQQFFTGGREATRYAINLAETSDVYAGVAPRRGMDGTKAGVARVPVLWGDFDARNGHTRESRWVQLGGLPCPPSMVVWSGGGFHAYWPMEEPARSPEEIEQARLTMRLLANGLGGDPVHDLPRVLRVPGSYNHKNPGEPRPVTLEFFEPGHRYPLARLLEMAESLPGAEAAASARGRVDRGILAEPICEHHRNVSLTSVAGSLRHRGLDAETIRVVLLEVNRVRCVPPLGEAEVHRIAKSIGRYAPGGPKFMRSPARRVRKKEEK